MHPLDQRKSKGHATRLSDRWDQVGPKKWGQMRLSLARMLPLPPARPSGGPELPSGGLARLRVLGHLRGPLALLSLLLAGLLGFAVLGLLRGLLALLSLLLAGLLGFCCF